MNVSLTPQLRAIIQAKVDSGMYSNASEVVREALRLLVEKDRVREERLANLRQEVLAGKESARAGRLSQRSISDIADEVRREFEDQ